MVVTQKTITLEVHSAEGPEFILSARATAVKVYSDVYTYSDVKVEKTKATLLPLNE